MSPARPRVLISGGTGFLGDWVAPLLSEIADITLLSRTRPGCLAADLTEWDGGINAESLRGKFDVFLHMAGNYDLRIDELEAHLHNVVGTHTALTLAQKAEIPQFIHISTVAVGVGLSRTSTVGTGELGTGRKFPDHYAASKAAAEEMVRSWENPDSRSTDVSFSKLILRLGVLVGDSKEGKIKRIDGPYHAPDGLKRLSNLAERIPGPLPLPGRAGQRLPLVPVDSAARAIVRLLQINFVEKSPGVRTLHLAPSQGLEIREFYRSALDAIGEPDRDFILMSHVPNWLVKPAAEALAGFPQHELEYLLKFPTYDASETERLLGRDWCPSFHDYHQSFWSGYEAHVSNR